MKSYLIHPTSRQQPLKSEYSPVIEIPPVLGHNTAEMEINLLEC